jgi:hypothetical protein
MQEHMEKAQMEQVHRHGEMVLAHQPIEEVVHKVALHHLLMQHKAALEALVWWFYSIMYKAIPCATQSKAY